MANEISNNARVWARAVEKAAHDREFRTRLLSNTHEVLTEMGGIAEKGVTYSVIVETATHHYLVLPDLSTMEAVALVLPNPLQTDGF